MTEIIEGDIIAAPSSEEMTAWKSRITALEASDPERAEMEITDALTFSNEMLRAVADVTEQAPAFGAQLASAGVGTAKLAAVRAAECAKRLDLSKDLRLEADMQVRRWERALGKAEREGQSRGEIQTQGARRDLFGGAEKDLPSPYDFASRNELHGSGKTPGIYDMTDGITDAEFETALNTAKGEGNVSRANVVRKLKADGVVDMATGEVIDPDTLTAENRAERQAERDRMVNLYADAQALTGALNRLNMLGDPRHVETFLEVHRVSSARPDFPNKHHNPADIRRIAQYLNQYATALEEQS